MNKFKFSDMLSAEDKHFTLQAVYDYGEHYQLSVVYGGDVEGYEICLFHNGLETSMVGITDSSGFKSRLDESAVNLIMLKVEILTGHQPKKV